MGSKENILQRIRDGKTTVVSELPVHTIEPITYDDLHAQFSEILKSAGGQTVYLESIAELNAKVAELYPEVTHIVCNIAGCSVTDNDGNSVVTPHELASVELAIIKGEFAVAENGAVWVRNPDNRHRALYFLAENIIMVVEKGNVVATMHDAYARVSFDRVGYGTFISGPSKTADIEQSLVIGAHGPKTGYVLFV